MNDQRMVDVGVLDAVVVVVELLRYGAHYPAEIREADLLVLKLRALISGPGVEPVARFRGIEGEYGYAIIDLEDEIPIGAKLYLAAPSAPVHEELQKEIDKLRQSSEFYMRRCDVLQGWQSKMRDPERTIVCDVLANGHTHYPLRSQETVTRRLRCRRCLMAGS